MKKIFMKMVNVTKKEVRPHRDFLGMRIVYVLYNPENHTYEPVSSHKQNELGMTEEELFEEAKKNTRELFPPQVVSMAEVLRNLMEPDSDLSFSGMNSEADNMFILTNEQRVFGAVNILYTDVIADLAEKTGTDLYIFPSSVHEMILLPATEETKMNEKYFLSLTKTINGTDVIRDEEVLSDNIFYYTRETGELSIRSVEYPEKTLSLTLKIADEDTFTVLVQEPESGEKKQFVCHDSDIEKEDKAVMAEIRSWVSLMREDEE